jgi:hypothetical protein
VAFFDAGTLSVWTSECPVTGDCRRADGERFRDADAGVRVTISPIRKFDSAIPAWASLRLVHQLGTP